MCRVVGIVQYVRCGMYRAVCAVQYVRCNMYRAVCTVQYVLCSMCGVIYTVQYVRCNMYRAVCAVQYVPCSMYRVAYSLHCIHLKRTNLFFIRHYRNTLNLLEMVAGTELTLQFHNRSSDGIDVAAFLHETNRTTFRLPGVFVFLSASEVL